MYSTPIFRTANGLVTNVNGIGSTGPTGPGLYYISNYENLNGINLEDLQLNTTYYYKIQTGLSYTTGQQIIFGAYTSNNSYNFIGAVVSYNSLNGDLNVNINEVNGTGTYTNWILNLNVNTGPQGPQGANSTVTGPTGPSIWSQTDDNIFYINGNVGIGTTDTSLGALTVAGGVINAQNGIISSNGSFTSLTVNGNQVATVNQIPTTTFTSQIKAPGGITGATGSFSSLLVGGNQVAITNQLASYAQLSGATFYGDVNTVGIIVNNGNSLKMITPPSNINNPANAHSTNFIIGNGIYETLWSNYFGIQQYSSSLSGPVSGSTVPFVIDYNGKVGINSSSNSAPNYTSELTVNGTISTTNLISSSQIQAQGGITGATGSFSSLLSGGNQVATINDLPNLSSYAQLSGATFTGSIAATGGITGATGSFTNLITSKDAVINSVKLGLGSGNYSNNLAIGNSLQNISNTGTGNMAIGNNILNNNTSGISNTAIGNNALQLNTIGSNNIAIGLFSLHNNTSGSSNISIGSSSLVSNTSGNNNTVIGYNSAVSTSISSNNTFIGSNTDLASSASNYNNSTAIGYNAKITSSDQIMLGGTNVNNNIYPLVNAPGGITGATGSFSSLLVGGNKVATTNDLPNLSGYAQLTGATFTGLIAAPGGITGATGSFSSLLVNGQPINNQQVDLSGYAKLSGATFTGPVIVNGNVTATSFNSTSDYRIKEDVISLTSLDTVNQLRPVRYYNKESKKEDIGLIAHEVQEVYPELVSGEYNGATYQSINYIGLIPVLINEIKMLKQDVKELKEQLNKID